MSREGYLVHTFDLLHVGDIDLVAQARERCDRLVVGVLTDDAVARLTSRRPVVPLEERAALVAHIRGVDQVVVHGAVDHVLRAPVLLTSAVAAPLAPRESLLLLPRRQTQSVMLRASLRYADESVASSKRAAS